MATVTSFDVDQIRKDFPVLSRRVHDKPLVYLDNAATGQRPRVVIEAMDRFWREYNANVHRGVHALSQEATAEFERARGDVRRFLNARLDREIVFTKGCTEAINLVAHSYGRLVLKPGDEVLVSTMEHHSNIVPYQMIAEQVGARVIPIPISDAGELDMEAYGRLLSERTKLVGIVHVSNSIGTINPVKEIARLAHAVGAKVVVDGAQAGPHLPIDVQDLDADFYALSCHKHFAPTGIGVLYGKEALLEAMPPMLGGGGMIRTVSFDGTTYADLPDKFEAGTPHIGGVIGLGAAVRYLDSIDRHAIAAYEQELTSYAMARMAEIDGVRLIGTAPNKTSIVSFVMDAAHPHDIGTILDAEGIAIRAGHHCCMPLMKRMNVPATARASLAFYSTRDEVDALVDGVQKVKEMFG